MSRVLPAKDICERALRAIGQFPITESAADGEQLREAMTWFDLLLAQEVGTTRMFSRIDPATLSMPITNGTGSYDLYSELGDDLPEDRIQYIVSAWLEDAGGNRSPVEIVNRVKFEDVCKPSETGTPRWVHLDNEQTPTLHIFPTPHEDDTTEWALKMVVQRYAPNVAPGGVTGTQPSGSVLHKMGQAWQLYLVFKLALLLGMGAITKLGRDSLSEFRAEAENAKGTLLAFENRTHETTEPCVEAWGA